MGNDVSGVVGTVAAVAVVAAAVAVGATFHTVVAVANHVLVFADTTCSKSFLAG